MHNVPKWYLKTLQEMLQDFENVFSDFGMLSTNGLNLICPFIKQAEFFPEAHSKVSQASKMEFFLLSILDVRLGLQYASVFSQILF